MEQERQVGAAGFHSGCSDDPVSQRFVGGYQSVGGQTAGDALGTHGRFF